MTRGNHPSRDPSSNVIRFDIDPCNPLHMEPNEKQSKGRSRGITNVSPSSSVRSTKTANSTSYHSSGFRVTKGSGKRLFLSGSPTSSQHSIQQVQGGAVSELASPQDETPLNSGDLDSRARLPRKNEFNAVAESVATEHEVAGRRVPRVKQGDDSGEVPLKSGAPKIMNGGTKDSSVGKEGTGKKEGRLKLKSGTSQAEESNSRRNSMPKDSKAVCAKEAQDKVIPRTKTQEAQGPVRLRKSVSDVQEGPRKRQRKGF